MNYYLAPLEGITFYIFREAWHRHYGGADRAFTPFLAGGDMKSRERSDVLPEHNRGAATIPQILTNRADAFLRTARELRDRYGYGEVNLNLGCPSGTVVSKHKGAGFLALPDELDRFLDAVFSSAEPAGLKISVKTRTGVDSAEDFARLLEIYNRYPLSELIVHPRYQKQGYGGSVDMEAFRLAASVSRHRLIYNGDITDLRGIQKIAAEFPAVQGVMCGRGLLTSPWLFRQARGEPFDSSPAALLAFLDDVYRGYQKVMSGDRNVLFKMKELWIYAAANFPQSDKALKRVRKCQTCAQYDAVIASLAPQDAAPGAPLPTERA